MFLLELTQVLPKDRVVLLQLGMLSSQARELFEKLSKFGLGSLTSHGSIRGLALHHCGVLAEDSELFLPLRQGFFKLGVFCFDLLEPLFRGPLTLIFGDLPEVAVDQCTSEEALQLKNTNIR